MLVRLIRAVRAVPMGRRLVLAGATAVLLSLSLPWRTVSRENFGAHVGTRSFSQSGSVEASDWLAFTIVVFLLAEAVRFIGRPRRLVVKRHARFTAVGGTLVAALAAWEVVATLRYTLRGDQFGYDPGTPGWGLVITAAAITLTGYGVWRLCESAGHDPRSLPAWLKGEITAARDELRQPHS